MLYIGMVLTSALCAALASAIWLYAGELKAKFGDKTYSMVGQSLAWAMAFNALAIWTDDWQSPAKTFASEYQSLPDIIAGFIGGMVMLAAALGIVLACRVGYEAIAALGGGNKKESADGKKVVVRGVKIGNANDLAAQIKSQGRGVQIGGIPVPFGIENRSFLFAGSPGTGKSVAIHPIVEAVLARGDRCIIVDRGGLYLKRHWRDGDVVLNPFDQRDVGWSPFAEVRTQTELDLIAKAFIPDPGEGDKTWIGYAQTFAKASIKRLIEHRKTTNGDLFNVLALLKQDEIEKFLEGTAAARLISGDAKGMAASVLGSAIELSETIEKLNPDAGRDAFSIKRWVREGTGSMYLTYDANSIDFLRTLIAAQIDIACREITSLPEDLNRRIWLVIDETSSIGKVGALPNFLSNARKNGGCAILGFQTIAQARASYGHHTTQEILTGATNVLTLRVTDAETAEMMSKAIGDHEIKLTTVSRTKSENSSTTTSAQYKTERAVMASELQNLPDLVGYLNLAGDIPPCQVRLPLPARRPDVAEPFIEKVGADLYAAPERVTIPTETEEYTVEQQAETEVEIEVEEVNRNPFPAAAGNPFALNRE